MYVPCHGCTQTYYKFVEIIFWVAVSRIWQTELEVKQKNFNKRIFIMNELYTLDDLCKILKISIRHLRNIRKCATFPKPILIGKNKVRFSKAKIDEWLLNGGLGG